jgi:hypothetical protein
MIDQLAFMANDCTFPEIGRFRVSVRMVEFSKKSTYFY